jgi:hypothetical protein
MEKTLSLWGRLAVVAAFGLTLLGGALTVYLDSLLGKEAAVLLMLALTLTILIALAAAADALADWLGGRGDRNS